MAESDDLITALFKHVSLSSGRNLAIRAVERARSEKISDPDLEMTRLTIMMIGLLALGYAKESEVVAILKILASKPAQ